MAEATTGKIMLEIVTPERVVVSEEVEEVVLPGIEGEFGVLEGHIPFLTALKVGERTPVGWVTEDCRALDAM